MQVITRDVCVKDGARHSDPLPDPLPESGRAQRNVTNDVLPMLKGVGVRTVRFGQAAQGVSIEVRLGGEVAADPGEAPRHHQYRQGLSDVFLEALASEAKGLL